MRVLVSLFVWMLCVGSMHAVELRVVSVNVNYANTNAAATMKAVLADKPDILFLQEPHASIKSALSDYSEHHWFESAQDNPAGAFGLVSKFPIIKSEWIPRSAGPFGAQYVVIEIDGVKVQLFNLHLNPSGLPASGDYGEGMHRMMVNGKNHIMELEAILKKREAGLPTIVAGDLNGMPKMAAVRTLTERKGLVDVMAAVDAKAAEDAVTWKAVVNGTPFQARFDYILCSDDFRPLKAKVIAVPSSDHYGVSVRLELKKP